MKKLSLDVKLTSIVFLWMITTIYCDYHFFETQWEYVSRQICFTVIVGICLLMSTIKITLPITFIPLCGSLFLATTEIVDELKFKNDHIKLDDYWFACAAIAGTILGLLRYAYIYNKKHKT